MGIQYRHIDEKLIGKRVFRIRHSDPIGVHLTYPHLKIMLAQTVWTEGGFWDKPEIDWMTWINGAEEKGFCDSHTVAIFRFRKFK